MVKRGLRLPHAIGGRHDRGRCPAGGSLDPTVDRSLPLDRQTGSAVGIDATFPFGAEIRTAGARPASRDICGPALAEEGHEYIEVADVPGWREYEFPELNKLAY